MNPFAPSAAPLSVTVLVLPGSSMLTVASVLDPMRACNRISRDERIGWRGGQRRRRAGRADLRPAAAGAGRARGRRPRATCLIVVAGFDVLRHADRRCWRGCGGRCRGSRRWRGSSRAPGCSARPGCSPGGGRRRTGRISRSSPRASRRREVVRRPLRDRRAGRHRRRRLAGLRPDAAPDPLALRRRGGARCGERLRLRRGARRRPTRSRWSRSAGSGRASRGWRRRSG